MKPILFNTDMVRAILDDRKTVTRRLAYLPTDMICKHKFIRDDFIPNSEYTGFICKYCGLGVSPPHGRYPVGTSWIRPRYQVGDILYVRETWQLIPSGFDEMPPEDWYIYKATDELSDECTAWRPSIHMPKEAVRIFLRVTDIRVERLQEISEQQAMNEGITRLFDYMTDDEYADWSLKTLHHSGMIHSPKNEHGWSNYLWHGHIGKTITARQSDDWEYQYSAYLNPVDSFSSLWQTTVKKKDIDKYGWDANPWVWVIEFKKCERE